MTEIDKIIRTEIEQDFEYAVDLRRHFHKFPEVAKEEFQTQKKIIEELEKAGITARKIAGTGVYAEIKGRKPLKSGQKAKTLVLRADIDALPIQETHQCEYASVIPGKMHD